MLDMPAHLRFLFAWLTEAERAPPWLTPIICTNLGNGRCRSMTAGQGETK